MLRDELFMKRCFQLAALGKGSVSPNPLVGCVIAIDDEIIGEGYHQVFGQAHAEVNAVAQVEDHTSLKEATVYVNLEPCSHVGKTPPCADLLIEKQVKRVVISCRDTHERVSGQGILRLQKAGIEVEIGILEGEGRELNRQFFCYMEKKRPYIILKWAQSRDGFISPVRDENSKGIHWISATQTQWLTHKWRAEEDAILVGARTALIDDPTLTVRMAHGDDPLRVLIDPNARVPRSAKILDGSRPTLLYTKAVDDCPSGVDCLGWSNDKPIPSLMDELHTQGIQSLIVEGGAKTLQAFIDLDLWDEARVITGRTELKGGLIAPHLKGVEKERLTFGRDHVQIIRPI